MNATVEQIYETPKASIKNVGPSLGCCERKNALKRRPNSFTTPRDLLQSFDASSLKPYESPRKKQRSHCEVSESINPIIATAPQIPDSPALDDDFIANIAMPSTPTIRRRTVQRTYDSLLACSEQLFLDVNMQSQMSLSPFTSASSTQKKLSLSKDNEEDSSPAKRKHCFATSEDAIHGGLLLPKNSFHRKRTRSVDGELDCRLRKGDIDVRVRNAPLLPESPELDVTPSMFPSLPRSNSDPGIRQHQGLPYVPMHAFEPMELPSPGIPNIRPRGDLPSSHQDSSSTSSPGLPDLDETEHSED